MRVRHVVIAAVSAVLLAIPSTAVAISTAQVNVQNFSFTDVSSSTTTSNIAVGDSVKWNWVNGGHTTTSDDGTSWNMPIDSSHTSFTKSFNTAGVFKYHCNIHPTQMKGTIVVGDVFKFTASTASAIEGDTLHLSVQRLGTGTGAASVDWNTQSGSATAGIDYVGGAATLNWTDGDTASKSFDVTTKDDGMTETADKSFSVVLSNPSADGAVGTPASVTITIHEPRYKPDAMVKGPADSAYIGGNKYNNLTAQTSLAKVRKGRSAAFSVKVQNDGNVLDTFAVKGKGSTTAFSIRYYRGTMNITKDVVAGSERTTSLAPGKSWTMKVVIAPKAAASVGAVIRDVVSATSVNDPTKTDAVGLKEKVIAS